MHGNCFWDKIFWKYLRSSWQCICHISHNQCIYLIKRSSPFFLTIQMDGRKNNTLAGSGRGRVRRVNSESHSCKLIGELCSFLFNAFHCKFDTFKRCPNIIEAWCHMLRETQIKVSTSVASWRGWNWAYFKFYNNKKIMAPVSGTLRKGDSDTLRESDSDNW